jgi:uncharacterized protein (DUF2062 family)
MALCATIDLMSMEKHENFLQRRLVRPLIDLLRQGVTPKQIALSIVLGVTLGVFPMLGTTTALCAIAALAFRLNLPAIQLVNFLVYPLQIAFLIPFFRLGEKLFGASHLPLSVPQIYAMMHASMSGTVRALWTTTWHAIVVWYLVAPLAAIVLYWILTPALRRIARCKYVSVPEAA